MIKFRFDRDQPFVVNIELQGDANIYELILWILLWKYKLYDDEWIVWKLLEFTAEILRFGEQSGIVRPFETR